MNQQAEADRKAQEQAQREIDQFNALLEKQERLEREAREREERERREEEERIKKEEEERIKKIEDERINTVWTAQNILKKYLSNKEKLL